MMKLLSSKTNSKHLLLCVFLSQLWGVTDSTTIASSTVTQTTITTPTTVTQASRKDPPPNVQNVEPIAQTETSITLKWTKVNDNFTYILRYNDMDKNITLDVAQEVYVVSNLTAGTNYSFTLITVFDGVHSTGYSFSAATAPPNVQNVEPISQTETSITLKWTKVNDNFTYILRYNDMDKNITLEVAREVYVVSNLTAGTNYSFTLITVGYGVHSTGYNFSAVTAPPNVKNVEPIAQTETSITLKWTKFNDTFTYILRYNDMDKNITLDVAQEDFVVSNLTAGTKYSFTLITVFDGVHSTGYNFSAATAPPNVQNVEPIAQTETSITLKWKKFNDTFTYILRYNDMDKNITLDVAQEVYVVSNLTAGTNYSFTLITVFDGVHSTGYNFSAVTAPPNVQNVEPIAQTETSITLKWTKVNDNFHYILRYNDMDKNITLEVAREVYVVSNLTAGTNYSFTLITVGYGVHSTGYNVSAVTAPKNVQNVTQTAQTETSITLKWTKVNDIFHYILRNNDMDKDITLDVAQEVYVVSNLTAGTNYSFTLITVFDGVHSTGYSFSAVTAPKNVKNVTQIAQTETSITLKWTKVNDNFTYILRNNDMDKNITLDVAQEVYVVSNLTAGTNYSFTLITVGYGVHSTGYNFSAVTAPKNVQNVTQTAQTETSITLKWTKVNDIFHYILRNNDMDKDITIKEAQEVYVVSDLTAGTNYSFTLITVGYGVHSTGYNFSAVTVPPRVPLVNVTERGVTKITLEWENADESWEYLLQINDSDATPVKHGSSNIVTQTVPDLKPGTMYVFSVFTVFSGYKSTAHTIDTVTAIDCATVNWRVTKSTIDGVVEGLFSNATATYHSQTHVSPGYRNVSFDGLYPGATYEIHLEYEMNFIHYTQCRHKLTLHPPNLKASCEYSGGGYSISIKLDVETGVWTSVEVNVNGETYNKTKNETHPSLILTRFQPAKTYDVSVTLLSESVRSCEPFKFHCDSDPRGVIAGSVCAVVLFCILVCLAIFIFLKRPDIISRKKSFISGSRQSKKEAKAISAAKFSDHFNQLSLDDNRGFSQEYEDLSTVGTDQTRRAALLPENKVKNRFTNVLPYDWCRVKLTPSDPSGTSDYINANYMPGYNSNREYIATQGPLPSTVNDFWRMVWEQRVTGIVMVTNCTEGGRTKCEQYWPTDSHPCLYGELVLTVTSEQQEANWTLREFRVKHKNISQERTVKHFHFTAWPDHGVPQCTEVLIQFRGLVRQHIEREGSGSPTVVHCSAGVGRTGTIIALDVLLQQLQNQRAVGINAFVHKMRLNRPYMVQTESQYVFLHQCIMDSLHPKEIPEENLYENVDMIYVNATALREFHKNNLDN